MLMKPEVYAGVKKPEWASRGSDLPAVPHLKAAALSSEWARDPPPPSSLCCGTGVRHRALEVEQLPAKRTKWVKPVCSREERQRWGTALRLGGKRLSGEHSWIERD